MLWITGTGLCFTSFPVSDKRLAKISSEPCDLMLCVTSLKRVFAQAQRERYDIICPVKKTVLEGILKSLRGFQRKYLRGLAHGMKPVVLIGQRGITDSLCQSIDDALEKHELIKMKFVDFKEKDQKKTLAAAIEEKTNCEMVGLIGHTGIFYRQQNDPEKRKISVPVLKG